MTQQRTKIYAVPTHTGTLEETAREMLRVTSEMNREGYEHYDTASVQVPTHLINNRPIAYTTQLLLFFRFDPKLLEQQQEPGRGRSLVFEEDSAAPVPPRTQ